jgi:hypothetical protein
MLKTVTNSINASQIQTPITLPGDVTLSTGNLVIGTSGKGIDFSATPGTGTSELLSDYEEGTWTPTYTNWTINPTTNNATYTKVGRLVTVTYVANEGVAVAGNSEIGGLPFTSKNSNGTSVVAKDLSGSSPGTTVFGTIGGNATKIASMSSATFTGLYWAFSTTYVV